MKLKALTFALALSITPQLSTAAPSINEMQGCQGVLDFIDTKLSAAPAKYAAADVQNIRKGLKAYNQYIQKSIVSPGLLSYTGNDKAKADALQVQVDAYKKTIVDSLNKRYPQNRLFTDHAVSINNCAKQAVPTGQALEDLKVALHTIVKLAKMN
jgi:hypothetical protein